MCPRNHMLATGVDQHHNQSKANAPQRKAQRRCPRQAQHHAHIPSKSEVPNGEIAKVTDLENIQTGSTKPTRTPVVQQVVQHVPALEQAVDGGFEIIRVEFAERLK